MTTSIGIDIGGTRIKLGLLRGVELLATEFLDVQHANSLQKELPFLEQNINELLTKNQVTEPLDGIGISLPCLIDSDRNKVLSRYVKYTDAANLDLTHWVKSKWGTQLRLENDAKAALMGEWQFGAAKGCQNAVMLTLGTGIGSAVLMDGRVIKGSRYMAGNLGGHMTIDYNGIRCNCGDTGCAETVGSSWALEQLAEAYLKNHPTVRDLPFEPNFKWIFQASSEGNELAQFLKAQSIRAWTTVIKNMIYAFDPEKIILSGGILGSSHELLPHLQEDIHNLSWLNGQKITIEAATYPDWAGVMGAAYLAQL